LGWRHAIVGLVLLFVGVRLWRIGLSFGLLPIALARVGEPLEWLGVDNFGWFAAGALYYKAYQAGDRRLFALAVLVSLLAVAFFHLAVGMSFEAYSGLTVVALFFAAVQRNSTLQGVLTLRPITFLGYISYPLYMLHNNIGIGLIATFGPAWFPGRPELAVPLATGLAVLLAWVAARFAEPWVAARLRPITNRIRANLGAGSS
jgi:peptidoglycan/LPS O-acetylase OafA/YrhL